jgi:N-acetylglucosamine-6-phosphate deacetylase
MSYADLPFERAIVNATAAPARLLGHDREIGRIAEGLRADFALWDEELRVVATVVAGVPVYGASHLRQRGTAQIGG